MNNRAAPPLSQDLIQDRYQLGDMLGSGGYGHVYSAFDTTLLRDVAIKVIKYEGEQTLIEAQALARCNSSNIVDVYDVLHYDGHVAIVMERVESLVELDFDVIANMETSAFLGFFSKVLEAVNVIHKAGLLHLDLKPSNILFTESGEVKVSDFGLSTHQQNDEFLSSGARRGSWECLAPEQLEHKALSAATDIFALGILLYSHLFKSHPFIATGDLSKTRRNIQNGKLCFRHPKDCTPRELEPLVLAMLSKAPEKRPSIEHIITMTSRVGRVGGRRKTDVLPTTTIDLPEPEPPEQNSLLKKHWTKLFFVVLVIAVLSPLFFIKPKISFVATTLVVPTLVDSRTDDGEIQNHSEHQLIASIIEDEAVSMVIDDPLRRLVSKKEWRGTEDWKQEAENADVDEIIISKINCSLDFCELGLSLYRRQQDELTQLLSKSIPTDDLLVFSQVVQQTFASVLGIALSKEHEASDISDRDLRIYHNYKRKIQGQEINEEDIAKLTMLADENPGFLGAQLLLGEAYRNLFSNNNVDEWLRKSQALSVKLKREFPDNPSVLYLDFKNQVLAKDLVSAERTLRQLKSVVGVDTTQMMLSESMLVFAKDHEAGYAKLLEHEHPRLTHSYFHHKAYMEEALKKYDELENTANEWSRRFPDTYLPKFFLANSYLVVGRLAEAEALYENIIKQKKDHDILVNLGISQLMLGKYQQSIESFTQALEYSPDSPQVHLNLAEAYKAIGDEQSRYYFLIALAQYGDKLTAEDLAHKSLILAHLGRHDEAIIELQKAAQLDNKVGEFFFIAAQVHELLGQDDAALYNAREAMSKGFGVHWFRLPWMMPLYQRLSRD